MDVLVTLIFLFQMAGSQFQPVVIRTADADQLGGWPIERKYYGFFLSGTGSNPGSSVIFDLSFEKPDPLHPESDAYFHWVLSGEKEVYSLGFPDTGFVFPNSQIFPPFSKVISLSGDRLATSRELLRGCEFISTSHLPSGEILIRFPETDFADAIPFTSFLRDERPAIQEHLFVYLDHPGITSYIVSPVNGQIIPTGYLYQHVLNQVQKGNWQRRFPHYASWILLSITIGSSAFLAWRKQWILSATTVILYSLILAGLIILNFFIHPAWFLGFAGMLAGAFPLLVKSKVMPVDIVEKNQNDQQIHNELTDLRYRLQYYENLSTRLPEENAGQIVVADGLILHPQSPVIDVLKKAKGVAGSDMPVLITGESGTGKEKLSSFIHSMSLRKNGPFIAVNCAVFNENLIESELFGYEKGAFTGAINSKPGRFELADSGTLFLDEIGETSQSFQSKLLRVLQEGTFERVGGTVPIRVSVRIIAATHRNPEELVKSGAFREDLFYRLNGYRLNLPALRERPMDIEAIILKTLSEKYPHIKYSDQLLSDLKNYHWKGNVRQLLTALDRALINASIRKRSFLIPEDFELTADGEFTEPDSDKKAIQILDAFRRDGFRHRSISAVAEELHFHRNTVTEYLRGWIVRYSCETDSIEDLAQKLNGEKPVVDKDGFLNRISDYLQSVRDRILPGIRSGETSEEILATRFRNLPSIFAPDLIVMINRLRNQL